MALVVKLDDLELHQMNVKTALLN
ncbi:uncharacterized protein G2W53_025079 [Senna tora]|uniref:Uncharacterized protein n=1 Tax=Senna tora TaxID=362788 RepID=A0A834TE01_9FABA|nr:uncharacterized protein G2W53_025079 [Senna tora]